MRLLKKGGLVLGLVLSLLFGQVSTVVSAPPEGPRPRSIPVWEPYWPPYTGVTTAASESKTGGGIMFTGYHAYGLPTGALKGSRLNLFTTTTSTRAPSWQQANTTAWAQGKVEINWGNNFIPPATQTYRMHLPLRLSGFGAAQAYTSFGAGWAGNAIAQSRLQVSVLAFDWDGPPYYVEANPYPLDIKQRVEGNGNKWQAWNPVDNVWATNPSYWQFSFSQPLKQGHHYQFEVKFVIESFTHNWEWQANALAHASYALSVDMPVVVIQNI